MKFKTQQITTYTAFLLTAVLAFTPLWTNADNFFYDKSLKLYNKHKPIQASENLYVAEITQADIEQLDFPKFDKDTITTLTEEIHALDYTAAFTAPELYRKIPDKRKATLFSEVSKKGFPVFLPEITEPEAAYFDYELSKELDAALCLNLLHPQFIGNNRLPEIKYLQIPEITNLNQYTKLAVLPADLSKTRNSDGITRKTWLLYRYKDGYLPSAAFYSALKYLKADIHSIIVNPGHYISFTCENGKKISIPVDKEGAMLIPYSSSGIKKLNSQDESAGILDYLRSNPENLKGAWVYVSEIHMNSSNFTKKPGNQIYPKAQCQMEALNAIISGTFFTPAPLWLKLLYVLFLATMLEVSALQKKSWSFHVIIFAAFAALTGVQIALWLIYGIKIWISGITFAFFVSWLFSFATRRVKMVIPTEK